MEVEEAPQVRIDLPVDAHLPDDYIDGADERLEAYRRLAAATTPADVDDVVAEWRDRFGEPPQPAAALADVARLRVEAIRVGLAEIVRVRHEVRLSPVTLRASEEVRLQRLAPRAVVRGDVAFVPAPAGDQVSGLLDFLRKMWPDQP